MAGAGPAILFMLATVAATIVGLYLASYAAHCFLVVLEQTAAGNAEASWPDEMVIDWVWKPFYLVWLVSFWLAPVWLLAALFTPVPFWATLLAVVWLLFPLSLLSSLGASSRWTVLYPTVLRRLAKNGGALLVVYLVT